MGKFPEWQWNFPRITVRDLCKAAQAVSLRSPYKYDRSTFLYLHQKRISYTFQYLLTYYTQELFRWSRKQHTHSGCSIVAISLPSLHPLFCWVVSTKSAACVRLKRQLILELHIWTIIDTCAPPHTTEREGEGGIERGTESILSHRCISGEFSCWFCLLILLCCCRYYLQLNTQCTEKRPGQNKYKFQ